MSRARALPPGLAARFIAADPLLAELDARLAAAGYARPLTAHRHTGAGGELVVRLVWRRRGAGCSQTHEIVVRDPDVSRGTGEIR